MSTDYPAPKRPRVGERDRTMLACTSCKQKKLKCDGQVPKCFNCLKANRDCLVEDPATGLYRPRDYLQSLEERVAYLEGLLQKANPEVALDHLAAARPNAEIRSPSHAPSVTNVSQGQPGLQTTQARREQAVHAVADDDLSLDVALLCLSATGREPHYFGPSSALSFSRIVSSTLGSMGRIGGNKTRQRSTKDSDNGFAPSDSSNGLHLPTHDFGEGLSRAYFSHIHPQYPFLHKPTFREWEKQFWSASQSGNPADAGDIPLFFVPMIYAIGSLAVGNNQRSTAEWYYSMALEHISPILELNSLLSIQSILCCAVYSVRSPVGASLWKISGLAIRHCIELGYHRSTEKYRRNSDILTKELSKRCFWVAYDIDRVAAFRLGRPVGISDESIDVELPLDIDDDQITPTSFLSASRTSAEDPPTIMTGALHVVKLRQICSKFSDYIYSLNGSADCHRCNGIATRENLRHELDAWRASVPQARSDLNANPLSVFTSSAWFQLAYNSSILMLYRKDITQFDEEQSYPNDHSEHEAAVRAFEESATHARELCMTYRRLYQAPSIQFTWGSLHILFLGGLTYLYCLWKSRRVRELFSQSDIISTCMACNTVLVIIAERWKEAASYRDIFETLSERTINMVCGSKASDLSGGSPSSRLLSNATQQHPDQPSWQDWVVGLDDLAIPQESDWLFQELFGDFRPVTF